VRQEVDTGVRACGVCRGDPYKPSPPRLLCTKARGSGAGSAVSLKTIAAARGPSADRLWTPEVARRPRQGMPRSTGLRTAPIAKDKLDVRDKVAAWLTTGTIS